MESILIKDLYAPDIKTIAETGDCTVYRMENESGYGRITRYPIYPGIELLYNDMHMEGCRQDKQPRRGVMEINHCRAGRFECEFHNGTYAYLGEGDLAINMLTNKPVESCFPLSHYHGISVIVDLAQGAKTLSAVSAALGGVSLDLYAIRDRLCGGNTCFVMRTLFLTFICLSLPGGVLLYWGVSSFLGVAQQWWITKKTAVELQNKPVLHKNRPSGKGEE